MEIESKIQSFIENSLKETLLDEDKEITSEMLEDIEKKLEPLKVIYRMLENEIEKIKISVEEKQLIDKRVKPVTTDEERTNRLRENTGKITEEKVGIGQIKEIGNQKTFVLDGFESNIIKYKSKIQKYSFHLAILEDNGRLFWVRPSKTRITQFRWKLELPIKINNLNYKVSYIATYVRLNNWERTEPLSNLNISLIPLNFNYPVCEIYAWFDLETLEIIKIKTLSEESIRILSSRHGTFANSLKGIENWILDNQEEFSSIIIKQLLNPKYEKKLDSEDVLSPDKTYELKLGKVEDTPILIFKKLGY